MSDKEGRGDKPDQASDLDLIAYRASAEPLPLRPAPSHRPWMDATDQRTAYRCLPMVIANQAGWELLCPVDFRAIWDGGVGKEAIELKFKDARSDYISSHFGYGILTFSPGYLFRTPSGHNLWCKGPTNDPKDGIAPLEGIIETDWSPYSFTMNWKFTRAGHEVSFGKGEPVCMLLPFPRAYLQRFDPAIHALSDDAALEESHKLWAQSRAEFNQDLLIPESEARRQKWQRTYMLGRDPLGAAFAPHETKLVLPAFREKS